MSKQKVSLTLDEALVGAIDAMAKEANEKRSQCIERLLIEATSHSGWVEFLRLRGLPSDIKGAMDTGGWHNHDGPIEVIFRQTAKDHAKWEKQSRKRGRRE